MAVNLTIKQLRKTAAQWTSDNTILADGVLGFETDTGKYKIGDGVTAWNSLSYPSFSSVPTWGSITGTLSDQTDLQSALDAKYDASNPSGYITGIAWGAITGTLSSQTDLQSALDLKANLAGASFTGDVSVTTSGSGDTLQLTNSGSGTTLNILNSGSGDFFAIDTNKLVVSNNGNLAVDTNTLFVDAVNNRVGIGTATPTQQFQIKDPSSTDTLSIYANTNSGYVVFNSGNLTLRALSVYNPQIEMSVYTGIIFNRVGSTEWMRIAAASGNVGINNPSPSAMLDIVSNATSKVGQIIKAAAGQTANLQEWKDSAGNVLASVSGSGNFTVDTNTLFVDATNNRIGIGTNSPLSRLHVVGDIRVERVLSNVIRDTNGNNTIFTNVISATSTDTTIGTGSTNSIMLFTKSSGRVYVPNGSVLIGTTTDVASSVLTVDSTTKGFLPPRMTGAQVEAIATPAEGLIAYATNAGAGDVTAKGLYIYNGTNWVSL